MTADVATIYTHFGGGLGAGCGYFRAEIDAALDRLEQDGAIKVELTSQATGPEADKSKELAMSLFKDSIGGGDFARVRDSVMSVYMSMPFSRRVLPGHTDETTIGREWEHNPFVRVWRGADPEGTERCRVGGRAATLVVWSPDYDGKGKAWVRFDDGTDAIVGGSRVERS